MFRIRCRVCWALRQFVSGGFFSQIMAQAAAPLFARSCHRGGNRPNNQHAATAHYANRQKPLNPPTGCRRAHRRPAAAARTTDGRQRPIPPTRVRRPHNRQAAAPDTTDKRQPRTPPMRGRRPYRRRAAAAHHTTSSAGGRKARVRQTRRTWPPLAAKAASKRALARQRRLPKEGGGQRK